MAISYIGAGTPQGSTGNLLMPIHASTANGDVVICAVEFVPGSTITVPAGFEEICNVVNSTLTQLWVGWTVYDSATWQSASFLQSGNHAVGGLWSFRGVETAGLCYDQLASSTAASSSTCTHSAVTTTVNGCYILNILAWDQDIGTARLSSVTNANLSGITTIQDAGTINGNGGGLSITYGSLATAGGSGATVFNLAAAQAQARATIALRPSGSYAGNPSSPAVVSVTNGNSGTINTTSHNVALPATVNAGDLLVITLSSDGDGAWTWDNTTAGTWTSVVDAAATAVNRLIVRKKVADGTEGGKTLGLTSAVSEVANWAIFRITGASGNVEASTPVALAAANINPQPFAAGSAGLAPSWGAKDTLWLGATARDDGATATKTRAPRLTSGSYLPTPNSSIQGVIDYSYATFNQASYRWPGSQLFTGETFVSALLAIEPESVGGGPTRIHAFIIG